MLLFSDKYINGIIIMADTNIAAQWQQSSNEATSTLATALARQATALTAWNSIIEQIRVYQLSLGVATLSATDPTANELLQSRTTALNELNAANQQVAALSGQIGYSNEQTVVALENAPNTQTNTAPANPKPGDNVTVTQTTPTNIENTATSLTTQEYTPSLTNIVLQSISQEQLISRKDAYQAQLGIVLTTQQRLLSEGKVTEADNLNAEIAELRRLLSVTNSELQNLNTTQSYNEVFEKVTPTGVLTKNENGQEVFKIAVVSPPSVVGATGAVAAAGLQVAASGPVQVSSEVELSRSSASDLIVGQQFPAPDATVRALTVGATGPITYGPAGTTDPSVVPSGATGASGAIGATGATGAPPQSTSPFVGLLAVARASATRTILTSAAADMDWRVKLQLAPSANYLFRDPDSQGILLPLANTNGIIFPYTPNIVVNYAAHYDTTDLTHSNYKIFQYKNSSIDQIQITCNFTSQDTYEANYVLAVIHFLRSVTKMFYGQDIDPRNGIPPPLCYLTGFGAYQFDSHPLVISSFNYALPDDVDYIRATTTWQLKGTENGTPFNPSTNLAMPTYVPTKIQIQITALPIVSRNNISNYFSFKEYATGELLRSNRVGGGGGIW